MLNRGAAILLAAAFLVSPENLPRIVLCPFRRLTGLPCPGCGLTHSFVGIAHGRFAAAWAANPFGFLFFAAALFLVVEPLLSRLFPRLDHRKAPCWLLTLAAILLVAVLFAFGFSRIAASMGIQCEMKSPNM